MRGALDELVFLHKQFLQGRILFRSARSINRLRQAVNKFVNPFGSFCAAKHAVRLNLVGKDYPLKGIAFSFAVDKIRSFDTSKNLAFQES